MTAFQPVHTQFRGRVDLLDTVAQAVAAEESVLLRGPAGIGKTRLAAEVVASVTQREVTRLLCSPATSDFALGALAPVGSPDGVAPGDLPALFAWYFGQWRAQRTPAGPPLLWIDDVQNLDGLSAAVLRQATAQDYVQLLVTHRSPDAAPLEIEAMLTEGLLRRVDVPALGDQAILEVTEDLLGRPLDHDERDRVVRLATGSPLFARELAESLRIGESSPRTMDALIRTRISSLDDDALRCAELIAAAEPLHVDLLGVRRRALSALVDAGIVQLDGPTVRLEHPLYGEVLSERIIATEREVFGELLDSVGTVPVDPVTLVGWQFRAGREPSADDALAAARRAIGRFDGRSALQFLDAIDPEERALVKGEACLVSGEVEEGLALLEEVRNTGTPSHRVEAASWMARYMGVMLGEVEVAHQILAEATQPGLSVDDRQLLLVGQFWLWIFGAGDDHDNTLSELWALSDPAIEPSVMQYELMFAGISTVSQYDHPAAAAGLVERLPEVAELVHPPASSRHRATVLEGWYHAFRGDLQRAENRMRPSFEESVDTGNLECISMMGATMGYLTALRGDPVDAITLASTARKAAEMVDWFRFGEMGTASLVAAQALAGVDVDVDALAILQAAGPDDVDNDGVAMFRSRALALHAEAAGRARSDDALAATVDLLDRNHKRAWLAMFAAELLDLRTPTALGRTVDILRRHPHSEVGSVVLTAAQARMAGDVPAAIAAAEEFERIGVPLAAARTYADVIRMADDESGARPSAIAGIVRCGMVWRGGAFACTSDLRLPSARQIEIATMAMHGRSTREIANSEHLSERTVENHVYRLCRSVGAHGLEDLRDVLAPPSGTTQLTA